MARRSGGKAGRTGNGQEMQRWYRGALRGAQRERMQVYDYNIKKSWSQVKHFISNIFFLAGTQGFEIFPGSLHEFQDFFGNEYYWYYWYYSLLC